MSDDLPDHVRRNREALDGCAPESVDSRERAWASADPCWGIWGVAESELRLLPDDLAGKDAIELGCGTAYRWPNIATIEWARQWPSEEVWKARKR